MSGDRGDGRAWGRGALAAGLAILGVGFWGLWRDVGWIAQPFYIFGWWGSILAIDGIVALRRGHSLLSRRRHVAPVCLGSVSFWCLFEILNLRFQNWYYVGVFAAGDLVDLAAAGLFGVAAFATVFTGIFELCELLAAFGVFASLRTRPRRLPRPLTAGIRGLGIAMAAAAFLWPTYLAPLVWGSVTFILEPWNHRRGARSFLRDIEAGDWGPLARTLLAGLAAGVIWESLNFFAPQKWIYTVRGLEEVKLFEMPLLGFLGFPGLALDCVAAYGAIAYLLLGNESQEPPEDLAAPLAPRPRPPALVRRGLVPAQVVLWCATGLGVAGVNIGSIALELDDLTRLSPAAERALEDAGIRRPMQLLRAVDAGRGSELARAIGYDEAALELLLDEAELLTFKGIGSWHGALLRAAGIRRVDDLRDQDPEDLHRRLLAVAAGSDVPVPRLDMVKVWILAARSRGILQRATWSPPRQELQSSPST